MKEETDSIKNHIINLVEKAAALVIFGMLVGKTGDDARMSFSQFGWIFIKFRFKSKLYQQQINCDA